ncbi:MAG: hypothetical protein LBO74_02070 [Candidatus Symbiothrix sp.]|jgi:hypothetical protein|nr:hypothetical protein [Candidatus Symbiothrix sp.]
MKKLLVLAVIALVSFSVFSQQRINREELSFTSESEKITNATGWEYSEYSGKWYSNENFIYSGNPEGWNLKRIISHCTNKFNYFQFKRLDYKSQIYYVLFVYYIGGFYEYPEIFEDWVITENSCWSYIYTKEEYEKIKSNSREVSLCSIEYTSGKTIDDIRMALERHYKYKRENFYCHFPIQLKVDGDDSIVRFLLPNNSNASQKSLETQYFEMNKEDFMKILID